MKRSFSSSLMAILILAIVLSGCGGGGGGGGTTQYTLNITVENGPGCTVTPATGTTYPAGTVVDLTPTGATGYALDHWGGTNGAAVVNNKITMDGNKNIVAVFAKLQYDLTVTVNPAGSGTVSTVIPVQTNSLTSKSIAHGQTVQLTAKPNSGYLFDHWEGALTGSTNPATLTMDGAKAVTAVFVPGQFLDITLRLVPGAASFPTGLNDLGTPCTTVNYPYWMAETEVTYEQWYAVKTWAVNHGYKFTNSNNAGKEGSMGTDGAAPTASKRHPVTMISWRNAIVWCNALTEYYNAQNMAGLGCVYQSGGNPIRNANDSGTCDTVVPEASAKGFRLPTSMEWELAARYRGTDNTNAVEYPTGSGTYWTKGNSASGATAAYTDAAATGAVAWYMDNNGSSTHPVAGKNPNVLGLYDMSGNVCEWCFDIYSDSFRVLRVGCWFDDAYILQLGQVSFELPSDVGLYLGFRPVRTQ